MSEVLFLPLEGNITRTLGKCGYTYPCLLSVTYSSRCTKPHNSTHSF